MRGGTSKFDVSDGLARLIREVAEEVATHHRLQMKMMLELLEKMLEVYQQLRAPRPWAAVSEYQAKSDHWGE